MPDVVGSIKGNVVSVVCDPLVVTGFHVVVSCVRMLFWKTLPSHLGSSAALIERGLRLGWG